MKDRLDCLLVARGLAATREKAQALILAGQVRVNGARADKPGHAIAGDAVIEVLAGPAHVSRGGLKLEGALAHFDIAVEGKTCADVGASTGGFTDCLLQHGARRVHAVDVGSGQLDWKLRNDPRVVVTEHCNARYLKLEDLGEPVDLVVCDVSFISVTLLLPALASVLSPEGEMVILVKPQFEAGKGQVGRGGIVRDPQLHEQACARVEASARALGFTTARTNSPILGAEGNKEFLLHLRRTPGTAPRAAGK